MAASVMTRKEENVIFNKRPIMLVDDEAIIALSEKVQLENYGYSVKTIMNGNDAITEIENNEYSLILMDIDLGQEVDGTIIAQKILEKKDIPIIFLSCHTEPEIVRKTEKITSYGYIVKNTGITVLDTAIKMAFRLYKSNKEKLETEKIFETVFDNLSDAFVIHEIICDENGKPIDYRFLEANKEFLNRVQLPEDKILGHTALELFPKTEKEWIETFGRVALTGKSEVITQYSTEFDRYYEARVYSPKKGLFAALFIDVERVTNNYLKKVQE